MNRLLIESMEGRILTGVTMFVGIMILIGWVSINEEARMQSFVQQHTGRAIERGGELFAKNCSSCHGADGKGEVAKAPALNNPHLFGFDPLAEYNDTIINANRMLVSINHTVESLTLEQTDSENPASDERLAEIEAELAGVDALIEEQNAISVEAVSNRASILASLQPAIDRGLYPLWENEAEDKLTNNLMENGSRLGQVGWAGDLHGYIVTTLIHGRPGSIKVWPNSGGGMASWSQRGGGPLRDDEIEDLTAYILNWDKGSEWTSEDFFAVQQFGKPMADGSVAGSTEVKEFIGSDVDAIMAKLEADGIVGDAANGEKIYTVPYGCVGCHNGVVGPDVAGTWARVENDRLAEAQFAGYTGEQYLIESIVLPANYLADDMADLMAKDFGDRISYQDLADIVAFLKSTG